VAVFLALEAAQRVGNVWLDRDPQVTGCYVFWRMWRCKRQYYSVSTTSAISIPYMYDHSCGHSLRLELLHYLLYAAACYVSKANDTSASVKRSVGADLDWHSCQLGEPKQLSAVGASICLDENVPLRRPYMDFSVPISAFNAFHRTNRESGWSESLHSITNHLGKLQFESPSVSESSDAGHDFLCCCLVADDVEFLVKETKSKERAQNNGTLKRSKQSPFILPMQQPFRDIWNISQSNTWIGE